MVLLPLFERLATWLLGIAGWCFFLGEQSRLEFDLTAPGRIALLACLACLPLLLWLHRRAARRSAAVGAPPHGAPTR